MIREFPCPGSPARPTCGDYRLQQWPTWCAKTVPMACAWQTVGAGKHAHPRRRGHCLMLVAVPTRRAACIAAGSGSAHPALHALAVAAALAGNLPPPSLPVPPPPPPRVVGVEHIPQLLRHSIQNVRQLPWARQLMDAGRLIILEVGASGEGGG